jgi:cytochrome P450
MTTTDTVKQARSCPAGQSLRDNSDPFGFYEKLRAGDGSPVWDDTIQGWLIYDTDQVIAGQRDESHFANAYVFANETLRKIKGGGANITLSNGEEHARLRRFHLKLLSPSNVERYRVNHLLPVLETVLSRLDGLDRAELVSAVAEEIPPRVICAMLGMPNTDDAAMKRLLFLNGEIVSLIESGYRDDAQRERALAASAELNEVLLPYIRGRRENPADDFISRVWNEAENFDVELDDEAALGLCRELYFAGSDTTVFGISNALYLLMTRPDLQAVVRADRGKPLTALVEESLRLLNVVQFRHRICVEDEMVGDVAIKRGEAVFLINAAANRDPDKYACPADADLGRRAPTDHMAFGRGSRACVGAQLARVEMREVVSHMLDRFPVLRLDPDAEQPNFKGYFLRAMRPLNAILRD